MREHGDIGKQYGAADLAHDVRLACHGLDQNDSEFVIGWCGKELFPLSHVVQRMRSYGERPSTSTRWARSSLAVPHTERRASATPAPRRSNERVSPSW